MIGLVCEVPEGIRAGGRPADQLAVRPNAGTTAMAAQRIGFFLVPGFSIADLGSAIEPLLVANGVRGIQLYRWHLISCDGRPVASDSGFFLMPHLSIDDARDFSLILIVSSLEAAGYRNQRVINWLRRLARTGCRLGAVDCGTILLARAGLLDGYRCTLPWQLPQEFAEEFPQLTISCPASSRSIWAVAGRWAQKPGSGQT